MRLRQVKHSEQEVGKTTNPSRGFKYEYSSALGCAFVHTAAMAKALEAEVKRPSRCEIPTYIYSLGLEHVIHASVNGYKVLTSTR